MLTEMCTSTVAKTSHVSGTFESDEFTHVALPEGHCSAIPVPISAAGPCSAGHNCPIARLIECLRQTVVTQRGSRAKFPIRSSRVQRLLPYVDARCP